MNQSFGIRNTPYVVQFLYYGTVFISSSIFDITGNGTLYIQGKTGTDRLIHFLDINFAHNGTDMYFYVYENTIFTANGTAMVLAVNSNRMSAKTAQFTAYSNPPTPTSDGTLILQDRIFGTSSVIGRAVSAASAFINLNELIFKKDTDYSLKIINNTTSNTTVSVHWSWYESGN